MLREGTPVDLGPAKQRAVLAVLLLHAGRPVPTHQIVDAVWGDDPPENGANVVQKYVAGLRRVLDPSRAPRTPGELLALTGSGYVLRITGHSLDAGEFMATVAAPSSSPSDLRTALELWRGEALAGLTGPVFEAARVRLSEARATTWERWAELSQDRDPALIPELTRLIGEFPLREGLRAQLMIALYRSGRQAEALATFREARSYLLDEFGIEPGELLQETHRTILRGEPSAAPAPPPSPPAPPAVPAPALPPAQPGPAVFPGQTGAGPPIPYLEVVFAAGLPLVTLSLGSWIYFAVAAARHRDRRLLIPAAVYFLAVVVAVIAMGIDPTPIDEPESLAENVGILTFLVTIFASSVHGAVVATHSAGKTRAWFRREQFRLFAALDPGRARHAGVGRIGISRPYDDGGLIDINHVAVDELVRHAKLSAPVAESIVAARPFHRPDELVQRRLLTAKAFRKLEPRLIAL
ncbi:BTAD domain-containing putative transcriptional regulator [Actinoplanes sp. CA-054009]